MNEMLLQFIWKSQYFNKTELTTAQGESLQIIYPGLQNTHQGPDFNDARIVCNGVKLAGSVELHLAASEWKSHGHVGDPFYKNVILHVVWTNDVARPDNNIPVLELSSRISNKMLGQYKDWMLSSHFIPCQEQLPDVLEIHRNSWLQRLWVERMERKSDLLKDDLNASHKHWEQLLWWQIARYFGAQVNTDAFEAIMKSIPFAVLCRHRNQIHQLESLLIGQSGLLPVHNDDPYLKMLASEYEFLAAKYGLEKPHVQIYQLRMRPGNFPAVRLAQLAMLFHLNDRLFSRILEMDHPMDVMKLFDVTANDFWSYHFTLKTSGKYDPKRTGRQLAETLLLNAVIPVLFAHRLEYDGYKMEQKLMRWMGEVRPEKNRILNDFAHYGWLAENAMHSQALLELKNNYCDKFRCLECAIGSNLLKKSLDLAV